MNKRINTRFIVGTNEMTKDVVDRITIGLSARYGGLTLSIGEGKWASDGDQFGIMYGQIESEMAYIFDVSCLPQDHDLAYMQSCFAPVANVATWVHCEMWETTVNHFNVKELASVETLA